MGEISDHLYQSLARRLLLIFLAWKTVLLLLAAFCPGPGYDTSGLILFNASTHRHVEFLSSSRLDRLTLNLFRWDALYFVKAAQRGYVHEQEWAFSWAYSHILNTVGQCKKTTSIVFPLYTDYNPDLSGNTEPSLRHYVWAGIALSNVCHLISVLVLFRLLNVILGRQQSGRIPFVASVLHVMSPAALFLCSPYAEALFSTANFMGILQYVLARSTGRATRTWTIQQDAYMISSGILFALATLIRSNGLLSGLIYAYDVASSLPHILSMHLTKAEARRLAITCVAGILVAIGFVGPQYLAYKEYCVISSSNPVGRPWCDRTIPSVYSWVQGNYWQV